jgi:hypothetical protein
MLTKIYLALLAVSAGLTAFFIYYAWSWLQSIGSPQLASDGYNYNASIALELLCITSVALLILANITLVKTRKSWAMWTTLSYFGIFMIVEYFWLEPTASNQFGSQILGRSTSIGTVFAAIIFIAAAAFVYANQFAAVRLASRMYRTAPALSPEQTEVPRDTSTTTEASES